MSVAGELVGGVRRRDRVRSVDPALMISATVCALLVAAAVLAPAIAPDDPSRVDINAPNAVLSWAHPFGTDQLGRDILSRVLYGARLSLMGAGLVVVVSTILGTGLAIWSTWVGGVLDRVVARLFDVLFAFPGLLLAVLAVAILGQGLWAPVLALSVAYVPYVGRVVRSVALRERNLAYIDACRAMGYSSWRICIGHILSNVRLMIGAQATIAFASALMDLAAVSFIGLGVQPPSSDWGLMVSDGTSGLLNGHPAETLAAGLAIVITVVAFNITGERLGARTEQRS